ncbi:MAG: hypothetical protein EZS28_001735 [Streblomastix strix]|uniref:Uncharacterized protein n=1 Tax=Streblomastix strix TaxID=222440 RepID=A0A5J4X6E6_9EUKA|nr:MAG: hypothetical protein EZS28_001735 [Streblomastix strix]
MQQRQKLIFFDSQGTLQWALPEKVFKQQKRSNNLVFLQEQGPLAYDEDMKALLVLAFMPRPEIEAFLADQGFVPPTFDMGDPSFIEKLRCTQITHVGQANGAL